MSHIGHPKCEFSSKVKCDAALRERLGHCRAMTQDKKTPTQCSGWAVDELGYCGIHVTTALEASRKAAREASRRADLDARLDAYLAFTATHPSVWDQRGKIA